MSEVKVGNHETPRFLTTPAGMIAAVFAWCILSWLVLRVPALRHDLLTLVPHRSIIAQAVERQLLAPRSIFLAGATLALLAACCAIAPSLKRALWTEIPHGRRWLALFVIAQVALAFAPVINLHAYYLKHYGKPMVLISNDDILSYEIPQAWPDANKLKRMLPPGSRIALMSETQDVYLMPGLAYPLWFFDVYPKSQTDWKSDEKFVKTAENRSLNALLRYTPANRVSPFQLEMIK